MANCKTEGKEGYLGTKNRKKEVHIGTYLVVHILGLHFLNGIVELIGIEVRAAASRHGEDTGRTVVNIVEENHGGVVCKSSK